MTRLKYESYKKQQLGQFMTLLDLSKSILKKYSYKILEPSIGDGSFFIGIIYKLLYSMWILKKGKNILILETKFIINNIKIGKNMIY